MVSKNKVKEEGKQKEKRRSTWRAPVFTDSYLATTWVWEWLGIMSAACKKTQAAALLELGLGLVPFIDFEDLST